MSNRTSFRQIIIFIIYDEFGIVWGVAPTKTQARKQAAWFLPKGLNYIFDPQIVYTGD